VQGKTLWVFARNSAGAIIRYSLTVGGSWVENLSIGGDTIADPEAVASGSLLHLFTRKGDNTVEYRYLDGSTWTDWRKLDGNVTSTLFTGMRGGNRFVFGVGDGPNGSKQLKYRYWAPASDGDTSSTPSGWSAWGSLIGNLHP
jgi:hypothetical protein